MVSLPLDGDDVNYNAFVSKAKRYKNYIIAAIGAVFFFGLLSFSGLWSDLKIALQPLDDATICPLGEAIAPASFYKDNSTVLGILFDKKFRKESARKLGEAVQVDTQVGDNQPDVDDAPELWAKFKNFHKYLNATFPTVMEAVEIDYVNTYGIVLHLKGSNSKLKPVMLTAHQDVVPVPKTTLDQWTYPPFSGYFDGFFVWGRGSSDCKNVLVGIMESLEILILQDYKPERSVLAVFGFDEEASGVRGALTLGKFLEKKFGKKSIFAIVDEGTGLATNPQTNQIVAEISVGEKGYVDVKVALNTPGGHSSLPPDHTGVGILGELAHVIENDQFEPILTKKNPLLNYYQCLATHSGNKLPKFFRKIILRAGFDKIANSKLVKIISQNRLTKYTIQTSQALDIVTGGQKSNALPEYGYMIVNHRIAMESSVSETTARFTERVVKLAEKYDLGVTAFGKELSPATANGFFEVEIFSAPLEPAPVSPSDNNSWKYLTGTVKHIFEDLVFPELDYPIITAPSLMYANTDTRHYWNLSDNIYRFSPMFGDMMKENHIHTVDEKIRIDSHLQLVAFFYEYIQALNKSL